MKAITVLLTILSLLNQIHIPGLLQDCTPMPAQAASVKRKTLREIGQERDIEIELAGLETDSEYDDARLLAKGADAVVIGRLVSEKSSFDGGDHIITSYSVLVHHVLKDTTAKLIPLLQQLGRSEMPLPLVNPLKAVRSGGVVVVNGHRVSTKLRGSEVLKLDNNYILFLYWSHDFNAYRLFGGASGAVLVNWDQTVQPLGSEKGMLQANGIDLQTFLKQLDLHY